MISGLVLFNNDLKLFNNNLYVTKVRKFSSPVRSHALHSSCIHEQFMNLSFSLQNN